MSVELCATYYVQLHAGFGFANAVIAEYLAALGVSHLYLPYLQAGSGSAHGYDVANHNQVNRALGSQVISRGGVGCDHAVQHFTNHEDLELDRAVTKGCREEFAAFSWNPEEVPDSQARETFERSRLDWEEEEREPHVSLLDRLRLIRLRRDAPVLSDGRGEQVRVRFDEQTQWLAVERGPIPVACNLAPGGRSACLSVKNCPAGFFWLLTLALRLFLTGLSCRPTPWRSWGDKRGLNKKEPNS